MEVYEAYTWDIMYMPHLDSPLFWLDLGRAWGLSIALRPSGKYVASMNGPLRRWRDATFSSLRTAFKQGGLFIVSLLLHSRLDPGPSREENVKWTNKQRALYNNRPYFTFVSKLHSCSLQHKLLHLCSPHGRVGHTHRYGCQHRNLGDQHSGVLGRDLSS